MRFKKRVEVVDALERQPRFFHAGLEIFLRALLGVKTDAAPQRALAPPGEIHCGEIILFSLGHPFTRARLHT
jgi:hypothetical protein